MIGKAFWFWHTFFGGKKATTPQCIAHSFCLRPHACQIRFTAWLPAARRPRQTRQSVVVVVSQMNGLQISTRDGQPFHFLFAWIRTVPSYYHIFWVVVSNIFYFHPYLGKWSILTSIFFKWVVQPPTSLALTKIMVKTTCTILMKSWQFSTKTIGWQCPVCPCNSCHAMGSSCHLLETNEMCQVMVGTSHDFSVPLVNMA